MKLIRKIRLYFRARRDPMMWKLAGIFGFDCDGDLFYVVPMIGAPKEIMIDILHGTVCEVNSEKT